MSDKLDLIDKCFRREDGTLRDFMIEEIDGVRTIKTDIIHVPPHKVKIKWFNYDGTKELNNDDNCSVPSYMWSAEIDGIPSALISKIEYPPINYESNYNYMVKVYVQVLGD